MLQLEDEQDLLHRVNAPRIIEAKTNPELIAASDRKEKYKRQLANCERTNFFLK